MINVLIGLFIVWAISSIGIIRNGIKKHRIKYALKMVFNDSRPIWTSAWLIYYFIGVVSLTPPIVQWVNDFVISAGFIGTQRAVLELAPSVYILTVLGIAVKVMVDSSKPIIRYNTEEQGWLKEAEDKRKERRQKVVGWLRRKVGLAHD